MGNNGMKTFAIIAAVAFVFGLIIGNAIWNRKKAPEKMSIKQHLTLALQDLDKIDQENRSLKSRIEGTKKSEDIKAKLSGEITSLKKENARIRQENSAVKSDLDNAMQANKKLIEAVNNIKKELEGTKSRVKANASAAATAEELKARIAELDSENQQLKEVIKQIKSIAAANNKGQSAPEPAQTEKGN